MFLKGTTLFIDLIESLRKIGCFPFSLDSSYSLCLTNRRGNTGTTLDLNSGCYSSLIFVLYTNPLWPDMLILIVMQLMGCIRHSRNIERATNLKSDYLFSIIFKLL